MNGLLLLGIASIILIAAYLLYGRYLVKTWGIDPNAKTPAVEREDGVDFVPSSKWYSHISFLRSPVPDRSPDRSWP